LHLGHLKPDKRKNRHPGKYGVLVRDPHRPTVEFKRALYTNPHRSLPSQSDP